MSITSRLGSVIAKVAVIVAIVVTFLTPSLERNAPDVSTVLAREAYIYHVWKDQGLSDVQASAVVGNFLGETGDLDPASQGGWHGQAFGIPQDLGERKVALFKFAKDEGVDLFKSPLADRLRVENEFVMHEFKTTETRAWRLLVNAKTVDSAEDALAAFERWRGWEQGRFGAEAGTHYRWAHAVYRAVKSGAFDGKASPPPPKKARHTPGDHSRGKRTVSEPVASISRRAFVPAHISPGLSPFAVAVAQVLEEATHLLPNGTDLIGVRAVARPTTTHVIQRGID